MSGRAWDVPLECPCGPSRAGWAEDSEAAAAAF